MWAMIVLQAIGAGMVVIVTMWGCYNRVMNSNQTGQFAIGMVAGTGAILFTIALFAGLRCPYAGEAAPTMRVYYKPLMYCVAVTLQFVWLVAQAYTFRGQFTPTELSQFDNWDTREILAIADGVGIMMMFQWSQIWSFQFTWTIANGVIALFTFHGMAFKDHSSRDIANISAAAAHGARATAGVRAARSLNDNV